MTSESTVWPKDWVTIANSNQWGGSHCRKHLCWKLFMSVQIGFSLSCYLYIWLLFPFQWNVCTLLNMEAEQNSSWKSFLYNECVLCECWSSLFLFRLYFHTLKMPLLPELWSRSSSHIPSLSDFIKFWLGARCLLDSRCIVPCGHLTGIANLCTPRTELGSFLLNLPSPQASQLGKWACTTPCPIVLFVCFFPSCCFSSNHLSSLPSHARIVFFLDCSKSLLTLLTKSSLPPVKLYPAVRKVLKHKSDHVTICFKVWNDYPLLKINIFQ